MNINGWGIGWVGCGFALGILFFAGLWWTVRRSVSSHRPALWLFGSLALRSVLLLASFYALARRDGLHWLLLALGFALAQVVSSWWGRRRMVGGLSDDARHDV